MPEKTEALKKAGILRNAADIHGWFGIAIDQWAARTPNQPAADSRLRADG
jgi:hypothetical protein